MFELFLQMRQQTFLLCMQSDVFFIGLYKDSSFKTCLV